MKVEGLFSALGDPTRRAVFERLRNGPLSVNDIAEGLPVTRPAVSQHLKVLRESGLIKEYSEGRRRYYSIDSRGLVALRDYLDSFWDDALAAFAAHVHSAPSARRPSRRRGR